MQKKKKNKRTQSQCMHECTYIGWGEKRKEKKSALSLVYRLSKRGEKLTGEDMTADPDEFTIAN